MAQINSAAGANRILSAAAPRYVTSAATKKAYRALKNAYSNQNSWTKRINTNIKRLQNMGDFDPRKSAYYQNAYHSLRQVYQKAGQQDMKAALTAAAANTGGYGNSYGATAGNEALQARLSELAAKVPGIYQAAEGEFTNRKNNLANVISRQQAAQKEQIEKAKFALTTAQALDKAHYDAAKYADSAARNQALQWWTRYIAAVR